MDSSTLVGGSVTGIAAVLGGANRGFEELEHLRTICRVEAVYAVNDAAAEYPGDLAAFVTLHPEKLLPWTSQSNGVSDPGWLARRAYVDKQHKTCEVIAHEAHPGVTRVVDYRWPGMVASGSSGLFAVKVALEKFERVVCCGVPMDANRNHFFSAEPWHEVNSFWEAWSEQAYVHIKDCVRSMSGRTAQLLGMPTKEFLAGGMPAQAESGML